MKAVGERLERVIEEARPRLHGISEMGSRERRRPGAWSRREILGHLVDSATNNLQRIVRAQLQGELAFPGYAQEGWVAVQAYDERPWQDLTALWTALNRHLAHVIARIAPDRLGASCVIGSGAPVTLQFIAEDYVRHLEHHLAQILEPEVSEGKKHVPYA